MRILSYEDLKGSSGREVWYRPTRYDARKLFPHLAPRVHVSTDTYQLHDLSLGGMAVLTKQNTESGLSVGDVVPVRLQQGDFAIFESKARVCRTETNFLGSKIAFNFLDQCVEFDKLLDRNVRAQIEQKSQLFGGQKGSLVPRDYRVLCSDALGMLRSCQAMLEKSGELAGQFGQGMDPELLFESCEAELVSQWRALWQQGNDLVGPIMADREIREATKELTEFVLTPEMRLGAIWNRSYMKPLGYPGDFQMMNQVYDWQRIGATAYEMLIHRLGLEVAECIATRMQVVRTRIAELVRERAGGPAPRILSLGSGPAREVELFLASPDAAQSSAEFTLIDQEQLALSYAFERTYPSVLRSGKRFSIQGVNMSFTNILRGTSGLESLPPQDLIYSVGLLDYLTDRRAGQLVRRLYKMLAPGGMLIIGNMNETPLCNLWPMEFITDWTLEYRGEDRMMAWAEGLEPARAFTETEHTGRVRLLYICKPA